MSMRTLKYHEQKLLKKASLVDWRKERNIESNILMHRFGLSKREELITYNKTIGKITQLISRLIKLPQDDEIRIEITKRLVKQLFDMGVIKNENATLEDIKNISASLLMARRLPVMIIRLKMAQNITDAVKMVQHGHIRVGPTVVTEPSVHITRQYEDYITWADNSIYKRKIQKYKDTIDDFELGNN